MGKRPPLACMATAVFACCVPAYAQHLCSSDLHSGDGLGHALAVSGEFALVGAPESDAVVVKPGCSSESAVPGSNARGSFPSYRNPRFDSAPRWR